MYLNDSEEKRIEEEKKEREKSEDKERLEREAALLVMKKEREEEQKKLRELERQLLEDKVTSRYSKTDKYLTWFKKHTNGISRS